MVDHIQIIMRVASRFIVCKRARVVALLKLWPEGEVAIKHEMRTGKRIRSPRILPKRSLRDVLDRNGGSAPRVQDCLWL